MAHPQIQSAPPPDAADDIEAADPAAGPELNLAEDAQPRDQLAAAISAEQAARKKGSKMAPTLPPCIPRAKGAGKCHGYSTTISKDGWRVRLRIKVSGRAAFRTFRVQRKHVLRPVLWQG